MNVIVSNLNKDKFSSLNIDIIKSINGEYDAEEIVQTFSNFFFNRMFLDITAIKNYQNISNIQKLSVGMDVNKIIILLNDDSVVNSNSYLSKLVSVGIYNFARNVEEMLYLYNNPNSYKDVAHYQNMNDNSITVDETVELNKELLMDDIKIIGIKNFTEDAGATSLIYMLKNTLIKFYSVVALEINKKDFLFYNDNYMISVNSKEISKYISKYKDVNIILIDLNDLDEATTSSMCTDVLYLVEPSLIKINKLVMFDTNVLNKLNRKKVILNKSFFNSKDIKDFEFESNLKIYYNLPCMYDRIDNSNILIPLLEKMDLVKRH